MTDAWYSILSDHSTYSNTLIHQWDEFGGPVRSGWGNISMTNEEENIELHISVKGICTLQKHMIKSASTYLFWKALFMIIDDHTPKYAKKHGAHIMDTKILIGIGLSNVLDQKNAWKCTIVRLVSFVYNLPAEMYDLPDCWSVSYLRCHTYVTTQITDHS